MAQQAFEPAITAWRSGPRIASSGCGRCRITRRTRNISSAVASKRTARMKWPSTPIRSSFEQYPKSTEYEEVLWRQYAIANRFLGGEWPKLWGYIPYPPSMDQPADMFGKIVKNGPYSDVAPHAQLRIGAAREKQKDYPAAVKAYETAADRYQNQPVIVADALYRRRHFVCERGGNRRIRPKHRRPGHRGVYRFHDALPR